MSISKRVFEEGLMIFAIRNDWHLVNELLDRHAQISSSTIEFLVKQFAHNGNGAAFGGLINRYGVEGESVQIKTNPENPSQAQVISFTHSKRKGFVILGNDRQMIDIFLNDLTRKPELLWRKFPALTEHCSVEVTNLSLTPEGIVDGYPIINTGYTKFVFFFTSESAVEEHLSAFHSYLTYVRLGQVIPIKINFFGRLCLQMSHSIEELKRSVPNITVTCTDDRGQLRQTLNEWIAN